MRGLPLAQYEPRTTLGCMPGVQLGSLHSGAAGGGSATAVGAAITEADVTNAATTADTYRTRPSFHARQRNSRFQRTKLRTRLR